MARIVGVDLNPNKRIDIALTKIYGLGRRNIVPILKEATISSGKRVKELTEEEIGRITKAVNNYKVEGDLRAEIGENIKRLKEINAYRGIRHSRNLPVRGQRTRSNARTKRGKRATIGAISKKTAEKMGLLQKTKQKEETKGKSKK